MANNLIHFKILKQNFLKHCVKGEIKKKFQSKKQQRECFLS